MLFKITFESLRFRKAITILTILSMALSLTLLSLVNRTLEGIQKYFSSTVSTIDLIVGPKGGNLDLLFSTVYQIGNPPYVIKYEEFEKLSNNPQVKTIVPISLGDSYESFKVIGTNNSFFEEIKIHDQNFQLENGHFLENEFDIIIGKHVASSKNLKIGDKIKISHGVGQSYGITDHHHDFKIAGILNSTYSNYDRTIFVHINDLSLVHEESEQHEEENGVHQHLKEHHPETINAMFVKTKNRIFTLFLQRQILDGNNLNAIIPAVELTNFWNNLDFMIMGLKLISYLVLIIGFISMMILLLTRLNERKREIAIYRSLGASPTNIFLLLEFETLFLTALSILSSLFITFLVSIIIKNYLFNFLGIAIETKILMESDFIYYLLLLCISFFIGLIPGFIGYRRSLKEGLLIKL